MSRIDRRIQNKERLANGDNPSSFASFATIGKRKRQVEEGLIKIETAPNKLSDAPRHNKPNTRTNG